MVRTAVVPSTPTPALVIACGGADLVAAALYGSIGVWILRVAQGELPPPEWSALDEAVAVYIAPFGAFLLGIAALLVMTAILLVRGREWIRPVQWMLSACLATLALVGVYRGHDTLCSIKLACAVLPMVVLPLPHVRAWFDEPYARTHASRPSSVEA